jgi:alpha-tubulin suppressor-like RCC1 family protein
MCDAEQVCVDGMCEALPDHCKDAAQNEDETDEDCGGSCKKCVEAQGCEADLDCSTDYCNATKKCALPACNDKAKNGYETGVDCGGATCRDLNQRCEDSDSCKEGPDCKSGFCGGGVCKSPSCTDGEQNQGETFVDCGGPVCRLNISPLGTCPTGKGCAVDGDCTSQFCKDAVCTKPSCEDGVKNQDETGEDCGGPTCRAEANGKCADGEGCAAANDCKSSFCSTGKLCAPAGCGNGAKDTNETDLDCGGDDCREAKPCAIGKICVIHADCASGSCKSGKCVAATCTDGLKNQNETDVDCGGAVCAAAGKTCATPLTCAQNSDCTDGFCSNLKCSSACKGKGPTLGCPCSPENRLACAGSAQKLRLQCSSGKWVSNSTCGASDNCTEVDGVCRPIIPACVGKAEGYKYCEQTDVLRECGDDLVSSSSTTCAGTCSAGACQAATCGDGKKQTGEQCDDGNAIAGDGCEPTTCQTSAILALGLGGSHSCALLKGGNVRCWGDNRYGQLGLGNTNFYGNKKPFEIPLVDLGGTATAIAAGREHTCALLTDGSLRCWGRNHVGQLGLGNAADQSTATPKALGAISLGEKATSVAASVTGTCAVLASKAVRCWGANTRGQLGLGDVQKWSETKTPSQLTTVSVGGTVQGVALGSNHVCAHLTAGGVRCWGHGGFGQLGLTATANIGDTELPSDSGSNGLVPFPSGRTVSSLVLGSAHSCARLDNGSLQCWGLNNSGQLGVLSLDNIGDDEAPQTFGQTLLGSAISSVVSGELHVCAVYAANGDFRCWGFNGWGQLGGADIVDKTAPTESAPITFGGSLKVSSAAGGTFHTCAVLTDASLRCWGANDYGQLGFGSVSEGTKKYVGGDASTTPDKLDAIRVFQ